ncbi:MAG: prepilin peptidase [Nitrospirae bacterium]|nr:prepilin peptidase [Nitrospirota bacterium]
MSIIRPSSSCTSCKSPIKPWDNIPVVSYILLWGKCRRCGERISIRYPFVELLNGVLYLFAFMQFGIGWHLPVLCLLLSSLVVITFIDLDFKIIPDIITIPGLAVGFFSAALIFPDPFSMTSFCAVNPAFSIVGFKNSLLGLISGGGIFYLIAILSRGGMGGGDIKLMAMIGSFMGWKAVLLTTFIGSLSGSIAGIILMIFMGKGRKTKVPFGPFLSVGAAISLYLGGFIIRAYFGIYRI